MIEGKLGRLGVGFASFVVEPVPSKQLQQPYRFHHDYNKKPIGLIKQGHSTITGREWNPLGGDV